MIKNARIIIFAKYPAAGLVKTRLIPALGASNAARLAEWLLKKTVQQALATGIKTELCVSPDADHPCWKTLDLPVELNWSNQSTGDLGERMASAVKMSIKEESIILIGTDCPDLDASSIKAALLQLGDHDAVITPALDGGYVLLGLRKYDSALFENIEWSTSSVFETTKQRLDQLGWSTYVFPARADIDVPEDLKHLPCSWQTIIEDHQKSDSSNPSTNQSFNQSTNQSTNPSSKPASVLKMTVSLL
jgi:rSAM/selenodomain-associated transferase 1